MSELQDVVEQYAVVAVQEMRDQLQSSWDDLTSEQKASLQRATRRLIQLEIEARSGKDVAEKRKFVATTVDEFKLVGKIAVYNAFWQGMDKALAALGTFLGKLTGAALQSLIEGAINRD